MPNGTPQKSENAFAETSISATIIDQLENKGIVRCIKILLNYSHLQ